MGQGVQFAPGTGVGIVGPSTVALIDADPRNELVGRLVEMIADGRGFSELVAALVEDLGHGLPDLALAHTDDRESGVVRLLLRGRVTAMVTGSAVFGDRSLSASGVSTWTELIESNTRTVELHLDDDLTSIGAFVVLQGVVPAARLQFDLDRDTATVAASVTPTHGLTPTRIDRDRERGEEGGGSGGAHDSSDSDGADPGGTVESEDSVGSVEDEFGDDVGPAVDETEGAASRTERDVDGAAGSVDDGASALSAPVAPEPLFSAIPPPPTSLGAPADSNATIRFDPSTADAPVGSVNDPAQGVGSARGIGPGAEADAGRVIGKAEQADKADVDDKADGSEEADGGEEQVEVDGDVDEFDHLFGATQFRPVSAAGVDPDPDQPQMISSIGPPGERGLQSPPAPAPPPPAAPAVERGASQVIPPDAVPPNAVPPNAVPPNAVPPNAASSQTLVPPSDDGDHDGMTVSLAQLRASGAIPIPPAAGPPGTPSTAQVHAVKCVAGHLNPPSAVTCRVCGSEVPAQSHVSVPRPPLGHLVFADGTRFVLSGPALLGRAPKADGLIVGETPELLTLPSPSKELSGTHLEVRLEGWQVVIVDRQSTNGTTVRLPNSEPQRLHPGEPFPIVPGTTVDMADEIWFTYEASA